MLKNSSASSIARSVCKSIKRQVHVSWNHVSCFCVQMPHISWKGRSCHLADKRMLCCRSKVSPAISPGFRATGRCVQQCVLQIARQLEGHQPKTVYTTGGRRKLNQNHTHTTGGDGAVNNSNRYINITYIYIHIENIPN